MIRKLNVQQLIIDIMKRNFFTLLFAIISISVFSQIHEVTISGYVTYATSGTAVVNHEVYIYTDSMQYQPLFDFDDMVYTNAFGFYCDTISVENQGTIYTQGEFMVGLYDCNNTFVMTTVSFNQNNIYMQADFSICSTIPSVGCNANFYTYPDSAGGVYNSTVHFIDASSENTTNWYWDFGDGTYSELQNPTHTFTNGIHDVCLFIIKADSLNNVLCSDTFCSQVITGNMIEFNNADTLYSSIPFCGPRNINFYFSGRARDYADGDSVDVKIDFGDATDTVFKLPLNSYPNDLNSYFSLFNFSHQYLTTGTFIAEFIAIAPDGISDTAFSTEFTIYDNCSTISGIVFNDSDHDCVFDNGEEIIPGISVYLYKSGTFLGWCNSDNNGKYIFNAPAEGIYQVKISNVNSYQLNCPVSGMYQVSSLPSTGNDFALSVDSISCNAFFYAYPSANDFSYYFVNTFSGNITNWYWSFGDGTSSTLQNPYHTYNANGNYHVCLYISGDSCQDTYCTTITIDQSLNCDIYVLGNSITNESAPGVADGAINIDVYGGIPPYSYEWSNGATTKNISGLTSGYYDVVVTDSSFCQTWATFEILNVSDSLNWYEADSIFSTPVDTCFDFPIYNASIYNYTIVNDSTISVTWILYDNSNTSAGFVTVEYTINVNSYYLANLVIECDSFIYSYYDYIHVLENSMGVITTENITGSINIFPNPVVDELNIKCENVKDVSEINILNSMGQVIQSDNMISGKQDVIKINTSSLSKGLYFVQLVCKGQILTGRFVK
ncbi:MAG TPA: PKD domain-containing protein [Bacteroidales bacterium]|nr:PKD domain-containing protein [Bacteroidales bacterium]HPS17895.1 PKD domain-containing protein [Bacteroidales bacterium]